jgi:hypothetical protein
MEPKGRVVIRVSVEVCSREPVFRTVISAESIEQAVNLGRVRYPGGEARVLFLIDHELFFAATTTTVPGTMRRPDTGRATCCPGRATSTSLLWSSAARGS